MAAPSDTARVETTPAPAGEPPVVIRRASPRELAGSEFAAGSMGPKVKAGCIFAEGTGGIAAIGSITDTEALLRGEAGTTVTLETARVG